MASAREVRFRVLYVVVGVALLAATLWVASVASGWWWAIPGLLCAGWWWTGIEALAARILGHDPAGDSDRSESH